MHLHALSVWSWLAASAPRRFISAGSMLRQYLIHLLRIRFDIRKRVIFETSIFSLFLFLQSHPYGPYAHSCTKFLVALDIASIACAAPKGTCFSFLPCPRSTWGFNYSRFFGLRFARATGSSFASPFVPAAWCWRAFDTSIFSSPPGSDSTPPNFPSSVRSSVYLWFAQSVVPEWRCCPCVPVVLEVFHTFSAIPRFPDRWCHLTICSRRSANVMLDGGFHAARIWFRSDLRRCRCLPASLVLSALASNSSFFSQMQQIFFRFFCCRICMRPVRWRIHVLMFHTPVNVSR